MFVVSALWRGCCGSVLRLAYTQADTPLDRKRKNYIGTFALTGAAASLVTFVVWLMGDSYKQNAFSTASIMFYLCLFSGMVIDLIMRKRADDPFIARFAVASTAIVIVADMRSSVGNEMRPWAIAILVLDLLLVCETAARIQAVVLSMVSVWLLIDSVELAYRPGLYDLPFFREYEERKGPCDCEKPPCAQQSAAMENMILYLLVFYLDFYFTRGFAQQVLSEKHRMQASVELAKTVAVHLANFNLINAKAALELNRETLPPELSDAFESILCNLEVYEPYLPQSLRFMPNGADSELSATTVDDDPFEITKEAEAPEASHSTESGGDSPMSSKKMEIGNKFELKFKRVTVMFANIRHSMMYLARGIQTYEEIHTTYLACCLDKVNTRKGVLDYFHGDQVCASFGGSRPCSLHAEMGAKCACELRDTDVSVPTVYCGLASGKAYCGDLGCSEIKNFTVLGSLVGQARLMEKLCIVFERAIVVDAAMYFEVQAYMKVNLILRKVVVGLGEDPIFAYELKTAETTGVEEGQEWMYQLRNTSLHNDLGLKYLTGELGRLSSILSNNLQDESLDTLRRLVDTSTPPPAPLKVMYGVV